MFKWAKHWLGLLTFLWAVFYAYSTWSCRLSKSHWRASCSLCAVICRSLSVIWMIYCIARQRKTELGNILQCSRICVSLLPVMVVTGTWIHRYSCETTTDVGRRCSSEEEQNGWSQRNTPGYCTVTCSCKSLNTPGYCTVTCSCKSFFLFWFFRTTPFFSTVHFYKYI